MKKIGIATVYTGYNYGSALQAYATKQILSGLGYKAELLKIKGSIFPGRDIRLKKLAIILFRTFFRAGGIKKIKSYSKNITQKLPNGTKELFINFISNDLQPSMVSYRTLKKEASQGDYDAFLCGSDQIWNSGVPYVDPFYYLRFAPFEKRIAFAPSFGRDYVPDFNKKKITKFVSEIQNISVRELSGAKIIKELTARKAEVLIDPTLVLSKEEWSQSLELCDSITDKYLLAYFLDRPSKETIQRIEQISHKLKLKIIVLPYEFDECDLGLPKIAGPREFVQYIKNAEFVCTDSFHGTAFSLNFNIPFYTFERNYVNGEKQSARIESILQMANQTQRYNPQSIDECMNISFKTVNSFLENERAKVYKYLSDSLGEKIEMKNNITLPNSIHNCTGCGICSVVCAQNAITIEESKNGFYRPVLDENKCTGCSLCTTICYKFDDVFCPKEQENFECYSAVNKDENELYSASSGGVSIELMRECLTRGYYVVGVAYDAKIERAVTKIAKTSEELEQFKGSKYFQSFTVDAFNLIAQDKSDQKYAIFGTPCQIFGVSKMAQLQKKRDKYIFVDFFCHGCPSLKVWDKYLDYTKKKHRIAKLEQIVFRSKTNGWHEFTFDFFANSKKITSSKYNDPFYELFFGKDAMNEACFDCISRSTVAKTDIRIGDFWGKRFNEDTKGVSAVVIASEIGKDLFASVASKFYLERVEFEEIIGAQSYGKVHRYNPNRRERLLALLSGTNDINAIVKQYRKMLPIRVNVKRMLKTVIKHLPFSLYLKIKNIFN